MLQDSRTSRILERIFIASGFAAAAVLLINAAKRAEILPLVPATQLVAPLAQVFSIGLVIGLVVAAPALRRTLGSVGAALYVASLAALVGVEFVINLVFPYIERDTISQLLDGPLGVSFLLASVVFLTATLLFFAALWMEDDSPKVAIVMAVVASVPIALRNFFPEAALQGGLVLLALAVAWLSVWLIRRPALRSAN